MITRAACCRGQILGWSQRFQSHLKSSTGRKLFACRYPVCSTGNVFARAAGWDARESTRATFSSPLIASDGNSKHLEANEAGFGQSHLGGTSPSYLPHLPRISPSRVRWCHGLHKARTFNFNVTSFQISNKLFLAASTCRSSIHSFVPARHEP